MFAHTVFVEKYTAIIIQGLIGLSLLWACRKLLELFQPTRQSARCQSTGADAGPDNTPTAIGFVFLGPFAVGYLLAKEHWGKVSADSILPAIVLGPFIIFWSFILWIMTWEVLILVGHVCLTLLPFDDAQILASLEGPSITAKALYEQHRHQEEMRTSASAAQSRLDEYSRRLRAQRELELREQALPAVRLYPSTAPNAAGRD